MNNLDPLLQRNREFAAQQSAEGTLMPSLTRAMPKERRSSSVALTCVSIRLMSLELNRARPSCCAISAVESPRGLLEQLAALG